MTPEPAAQPGPDLAPESARALFDRARELSAQAEAEWESGEALRQEAHVVAVREAQDRLLKRLTDGLWDRVLEAARAGRRWLELLCFEGDCLDGEFYLLYLIKGPRQGEPGVEPLLTRLRRELAPFKVRHEWRQGTNFNRLVLTWSGS